LIGDNVNGKRIKFFGNLGYYPNCPGSPYGLHAVDGYGLELYTMRNGYQWSGVGVDDEMLSMIKAAIDEHFEIIDNKGINSAS